METATAVELPLTKAVDFTLQLVFSAILKGNKKLQSKYLNEFSEMSNIRLKNAFENI